MHAQPSQPNVTQSENGANSRNCLKQTIDTSSTLVIFILSDVCFVREGLLAAFRSDVGFPYVVAGASADDALAMQMPRVILLDAVFPNAEAVAKALLRTGQCRLIVLAIEEKTEVVVEWAKLGAAGYVPRHASIRQMLDTVKGVIRGEQTCAPTIAAGLIRHISELRQAPFPQYVHGDAQLTVRESEIVQLLGAGSSNKDIARRLNIEVTTTKSHVHNILNKLGLQRRSQVAYWLQDQRAKGVGSLLNR